MTTQAPCDPAIIWQLSETDKFLYVCLKSSVASNAAKSPRNLRLDTFSDMLEAIKTFVCRNNKDDALRGMVCGIFWLPDGLAVNIHRLRQVVPKCKSSINGSLQKIGFTVNLGRSECAQTISGIFPVLKENTAELRKWTIRKRDETQKIESPRSNPRSEKFEISLEGLRKARPVAPGPDLPGLDLGPEFDEIRLREDPIEDSRLWATVRPAELSRDVFGQFIDEMWIGTQ
jgi:hypothetical protein